VLRLVTIDCWDTILRNDGLWDSRLTPLVWRSLKGVQPSLSLVEVASAYGRESDDFSKKLAQAHTTTPMIRRLAHVMELTGVTVTKELLDELRDRVERAILDPLPELMPGAQTFVTQIRQLGVGLCLVSNTGWFSARAIKSALKARRIDKGFDHMIFSDVFGHAKPAPQIFQHALRLFHCSSEQALHIGDQLPTDVVGARNAGLKALHLQMIAAESDAAHADELELMRSRRAGHSLPWLQVRNYEDALIAVKAYLEA
jgi:HAD superfamily hydrolase (TIGR01509 family)